MKKAQIESLARKVQLSIWDQRENIWPRGIPDLREMFQPEVAARVLSVNLEHVPSIGGHPFGFRGQQFEIAGLIDRQAQKIVISDRFPSDVKRFTAAHEIGHWLMHPHEIMHRDRPVKGLHLQSNGRSTQEKEADYFAACLLMPRKLVKSALEVTFDIEAPFIITDSIAFALNPNDPESLLSPTRDSLEPALTVASVEVFQGSHFNSLAKQFKVSASTMAIRLYELGLIQIR